MKAPTICVFAALMCLNAAINAASGITNPLAIAFLKLAAVGMLFAAGCFTFGAIITLFDRS
jgi:hypothetical protein